MQQLADPAAPHSHIDKQAGKVKETAQCRAPAQGNKASNHQLKTPVGVEAATGETPSLTGEFVGSPRTYTNPPTQEAAPEGPNLLVGSGRTD